MDAAFVSIFQSPSALIHQPPESTWVDQPIVEVATAEAVVVAAAAEVIVVVTAGIMAVAIVVAAVTAVVLPLRTIVADLGEIIDPAVVPIHLVIQE